MLLCLHSCKILRVTIWQRYILNPIKPSHGCPHPVPAPHRMSSGAAAGDINPGRCWAGTLDIRWGGPHITLNHGPTCHNPAKKGTEKDKQKQAMQRQANQAMTGFINPSISCVYVLSLILSVTLTSFTAPYNSWLELLGRVSKLFYLSAVITVLVILYRVPTIWSSGH